MQTVADPPKLGLRTQHPFRHGRTANVTGTDKQDAKHKCPKHVTDDLAFYDKIMRQDAEMWQRGPAFCG